jgi:hypothetical protein
VRAARGVALARALAVLGLFALQASAQVVPPPAVPPEAGPRLHDKPQGIYAGIEIHGQLRTIARLRELIPTPRREAIAAALQNPAALSPPALYALANAISQDDANMRDAVFWYHVGRLRAVYDALRCKDPTARNAVNILGRNLNPDIARYQRQRRQYTLEIAEAAIKWDQNHPREYDHRWVNLYGKVARESAGTDPSELTVSELEWPAILKHVHEAHLKSVQDFAAGSAAPK